MGTKVCTRCGVERDVTQYRKHPGFSDGLNSACKVCLGAADKRRYHDKKEEILLQQKGYVQQKKEANPEVYLKRRREIAAKHRANPDNTIKLRYLKARYGLTLDQYQEMERAQGGLCRICSKPPSGRWSRLHVDHDHVTGRVRGLICFACNVMLGFARDNPGVLERAISYLSQNQDQDSLTCAAL